MGCGEVEEGWRGKGWRGGVVEVEGWVEGWGVGEGWRGGGVEGDPLIENGLGGPGPKPTEVV